LSSSLPSCLVTPFLFFSFFYFSTSPFCPPLCLLVWSRLRVCARVHAASAYARARAGALQADDVLNADDRQNYLPGMFCFLYTGLSDFCPLLTAGNLSIPVLQKRLRKVLQYFLKNIFSNHSIS